MKRLFAAVILCLAAMLVARGQEVVTAPTVSEVPLEQELKVQEWKRNEIGFSTSFGTGMQTAAILGSAIASLIGTIKNKDFYFASATIIPCLSVEYDHWVSEKVAIGVELAADIASGLPKIFAANISLMPSVKYKWGTLGIVDFYSRFAAGFNHFVYGVDDNGSGMEYMYTNTIMELQGSVFDRSTLLTWLISPPFACQLTLIGISVPTAANGLSFFHEIGTGTQGSAKFGLKLTF